MLAKIEQLLQEIEGLHAANAEELEALRIKYLSKKGAINELMADFRNVPADQKKEVGMKLNELKNKAQERISTLKEAFETQDNSVSISKGSIFFLPPPQELISTSRQTPIISFFIFYF